MVRKEDFYKKLRHRHNAGEYINLSEAREELEKSILTKIKLTEKKFIYFKLEKYFGKNKDLKILDFGCGGGHLLIYLRMLGYKTVCGVDVTSQTGNIDFVKKMGFGDPLL